MSTRTIQSPVASKAAIVYPETDGQPMAENTLQFERIVTIKEGIDRVFLPNNCERSESSPRRDR